MEPYDSNKAELCRRFPAFKAGLDALDPESLGVARAADGGLCFARRKAGGAWEAVTDPKAPLQAAAAGVARMEPRLLKGLGPAVVVGLRPGHVLDSVYAHFKSRLKFNEPFRRVYVLVDNFEHLGCWLKVSDRSELLTRTEVEFFRAEDLGEIVRLCEADEQRSHLFIPVSELPEDKLNALIAPLADFYLRREAETERLKAANDAYYDALSDTALAAALQGEAGRAPRLMALAHRSSQVVQFSARDTCAAFTKLGWETKLLLIEQDLSPWRLAKAIAEFKPDVFLMVNHLRTENGEHLSLYPANMLFVTWVQDSMPSVNRHDAAERWNAMASPRRRDLLIGYVDQLRPFGYLAERLFPCSMVVNTDIFHLRELTAEQKEKYGCDVCFASNRSKTTEEILASELAPALEPRGFARATLEEIHAALWREYRDGATFTSYGELKDFLLGFAAFREVFAPLAADDQGNVVETVFWRLNDVIYRHVVLEWLDELGVKLNLYGQGWEKHPRFAKHAQGPVAHGEELSVAYQAAKFCLHLNSMEGSHQRLLEILATGGAPLMRAKNLGRLMSPDLAEALRFAAKKLYGFDAVPATGLSPEQERQLNDFLFRLAQNASRQDPGAVGEALPAACGREARRWLETRPDWLVPDWRGRHFSDKAGLDKLLRGARTTATSSQRQPLIDAATAGALREAVLTTLATSPAAAGFPFELGPSRFSAALDAAAPTPELKAAFAATPHPGFEMTSQLLTRLLDEGEQEEARALLERFAPENLDAPRRIDYAVFLAQLGETKRAEALVADAYAEDSGLTDAHARLGWARHWGAAEYAAVVADCERDATLGRLSAAWRQHLASAYSADKRHPEAVRALDAAVGRLCRGWAEHYLQHNYADALRLVIQDKKGGRLQNGQLQLLLRAFCAVPRLCASAAEWLQHWERMRGQLAADQEVRSRILWGLFTGGFRDCCAEVVMADPASYEDNAAEFDLAYLARRHGGGHAEIAREAEGKPAKRYVKAVSLFELGRAAEADRLAEELAEEAPGNQMYFDLAWRGRLLAGDRLLAAAFLRDCPGGRMPHFIAAYLAGDETALSRARAVSTGASRPLAAIFSFALERRGASMLIEELNLADSDWTIDHFRAAPLRERLRATKAGEYLPEAWASEYLRLLGVPPTGTWRDLLSGLLTGGGMSLSSNNEGECRHAGVQQ